MAAVISISSLTNEQLELIQQCLTIFPIDPDEENPKYKFRKGFRPPKKISPPVQMYQLSNDGKEIRLPLAFANTLLGTIHNTDQPHVKIVNQEEGKLTPEFQVQLRENQISLTNEALELLKTYSTVTLGLPPATGKTIIGTFLGYLCGDVIMVYVNRDTLMRQWKETFIKCVPKYKDYIWCVGEEEPPSEGFPAFIICMDERYDKIPERIRKSIGTLIIDEAHLFCTPTRVSALLAITPKQIIVETATLERDDGMHQMMHCLAGVNGVFMISKCPYHVIQLETGIHIELVRNKYGINYDQLCKSLAADKQRNQIIVDIVKTNPHRKFIILSKLADHVRLLELLLKIEGIKCGTLYRNQSSYSDSIALIGTMPKIGTGFDEENACEDFQGVKSNVLILTHSVKKWQQYEQFRGRVMRSKTPTVIWLNDKVPTVRNHFKGLSDWIQQTNGIIVPLDYFPGQVVLPECE